MMQIYEELVARGLIAQVTDEKEIREYHVNQLRFKPRRKKNRKLSPQELKELAALEDKGEAKSKLDDTH